MLHCYSISNFFHFYNTEIIFIAFCSFHVNIYSLSDHTLANYSICHCKFNRGFHSYQISAFPNFSSLSFVKICFSLWLMSSHVWVQLLSVLFVIVLIPLKIYYLLDNRLIIFSRLLIHKKIGNSLEQLYCHQFPEFYLSFITYCVPASAIALLPRYAVCAQGPPRTIPARVQISSMAK